MLFNSDACPVNVARLGEGCEIDVLLTDIARARGETQSDRPLAIAQRAFEQRISQVEKAAIRAAATRAR